jgi:thioesterase domain-containing protein/acyl carrier protein
VTADPPTLDDRQLATYLESELPAHMRPAQFVFMAALPRTVQGKLDRKMLPAPARPDGSAAAAAPVTVAEIAMAALWRTALRVDTVGRNDNFFSLGGNSLLAIQFITRLGDEFGVELTLGDLLDYPTLTALAALVERRRQGGREEGPDRRELFQLKAGEGAPFFCASGAGDVLGSYAPLAQSLREGQPFYCFSDRLLDLSESDDFTIESMAANFVSHIRSVKPSGPYILGGYSFGGVLAFEAAKQLLEAGEAVSGVIMLDTSATLDGTEARQFSLRAARHWARRLLVRAWATAYTWKLQIGYARDIVPVLRRQDSRPAPRLKECLQWIWYDTLNQYFMMHAGLYRAHIGDRRLEMIRETTVQQTTRRVALMSAAQQAYAYSPIPAKIVVIRVAHDPWREARLDETLGWRQFAGQGVDVHVIPGNHFVMHREPFVRELGNCLQQNLDNLAALAQVVNSGSATPRT